MHYLQINVEIKEGLTEPVVTIRCGKKDHFIEQLIAALRIMDRQLTVSFHGAATTLALSEILNIDSIRAYLDRRLLITMSNGEQLIVSRQYAPELKHLLGVK